MHQLYNEKKNIGGPLLLKLDETTTAIFCVADEEPKNLKSKEEEEGEICYTLILFIGIQYFASRIFGLFIIVGLYFGSPLFNSKY